MYIVRHQNQPHKYVSLQLSMMNQSSIIWLFLLKLSSTNSKNQLIATSRLRERTEPTVFVTEVA